MNYELRMKEEEMSADNSQFAIRNSQLFPAIRHSLFSRGFTLIELLVVVAMIAVIMGAMTTSVTSARERAKVQKATSDVKVIAQAILAYENYSRGGNFELETMERRDADKGSLGFLLGQEAAESGGKIPAMLMAQLQGGKMTDPWGTPYKVTIREGHVNAAQNVNLSTGFALPNFYRLSETER